MAAEDVTPEEFVAEIREERNRGKLTNREEYVRLVGHARAWAVIACSGYIPEALEAELKELEAK